MRPLRERMLDALQLRALADRTQEAYIGCCGPTGAALRSQPRQAVCRAGAVILAAPAARAQVGARQRQSVWAPHHSVWIPGQNVVVVEPNGQVGKARQRLVHRAGAISAE